LRLGLAAEGIDLAAPGRASRSFGVIDEASDSAPKDNGRD
jgi:hypothetical protein